MILRGFGLLGVTAWFLLPCSELVRELTRSEHTGVTAATPGSPLKSLQLAPPLDAMSSPQQPLSDARPGDWREISQWLANFRQILHSGGLRPAFAHLDAKPSPSWSKSAASAGRWRHP